MYLHFCDGEKWHRQRKTHTTQTGLPVWKRCLHTDRANSNDRMLYDSSEWFIQKTKDRASLSVSLSAFRWRPLVSRHENWNYALAKIYNPRKVYGCFSWKKRIHLFLKSIQFAFLPKCRTKIQLLWIVLEKPILPKCLLKPTQFEWLSRKNANYNFIWIKFEVNFLISVFSHFVKFFLFVRLHFVLMWCDITRIVNIISASTQKYAHSILLFFFGFCIYLYEFSSLSLI